jgi:uncharacterized membrane protein
MVSESSAIGSAVGNIVTALTAAEESSHAVEVVEQSSLVLGLDVVSVVVASVIGYIGVAVMTYGCFVSLYRFVVTRTKVHDTLPMIRVNLGKHLALGLEFLVGKDIVESIVHPTWDDLGKLGAIIALRTVLTIFLSRELKEIQEELEVEKKELEIVAMEAKRA